MAYFTPLINYRLFLAALGAKRRELLFGSDSR